MVVVAQMSHRLAEHPTWEGVGWFVFLFFAVWSSWTNGTLYYDLHGTNDVSVRVFTFAQMLAVALMGVFVGNVPGDGEPGFALAYAVNVLVLVLIWFRTGVHDSTHRAASNPYSGFYLLSALTFAGSIWASPPGRYWLWALGLALQIIGQIVAFRRWTPPESQGGEAVIAVTGSLVERLDLFVIIVLGKVIVGSLPGMVGVEVLGLLATPAAASSVGQPRVPGQANGRGNGRCDVVLAHGTQLTTSYGLFTTDRLFLTLRRFAAMNRVRPASTPRSRRS